MAVPDAAFLIRLMTGMRGWARLAVPALSALGMVSVVLSASALAVGSTGGRFAHAGDPPIQKVKDSTPAPGATYASSQTKSPALPVGKPVSPAEMPTNPAVVTLNPGSLTVEANNSDLAKILRRVASMSGMQIDGLNRSMRVFGHYGPGDPRDVLSRLLIGSGYNFIMAGDTPDGTPRRLLLTAKSGSTSSSPATQTQSSKQAEPASQPQSPAPEPQQLAPPASSPAANTKDTEQQREDRMQRFLERLQKMHQGQNQEAPE